VTATAAGDLDPYMLPMPAPASPVVLPHRTGALHAHLNGRYADPVWPLAPLTDDPSAPRPSVYWQAWPAVFREEMRLAAWNLINGQLRPTYLQEHNVSMRARLGLAGTHQTLLSWKTMAAWLAGRRGISSLAGCTGSVLHDYGTHVRDAGYSRSYVYRVLAAVSRLWALDQLSARPSGIGRPPWEDAGIDDYVPAAAGGGENSTEPLAEQTIGPLLIWAMRLVDDLSGDVLAAWAEWQRITQVAGASTGTPVGKAAVDAYFRSLAASQAPVPAASSASGRTTIARTYIGGIAGASRRQVGWALERNGITAAAVQRPGPCPLSVPVTGQIRGRPWRAALDYNEVPALMRHLATAAFIVCAYLTGMRPAEILGLRTGCCPDPVPDADGRTGRHLIRGREYKNATDEHGNHQSAGVERDVPWVAITPVVNAIRVLERMVPDGHLLFDWGTHVPCGSRDRAGSMKTDTLERWIGSFTAWANSEARDQGLPGEVIPDDPHGNITASRFRRSLAWHIARRPNGHVALAIQYGHMRTSLTWASEGYAARSRDGIHDLIDLETARAAADTVAALHDDLGNGGGISGPAARRAIRAAATAPRFAGTPITLASARKLLKNEDAMIYDNPNALILCHYKPDRALCHRDGIKDTPSLDRCVPGCGNIARTDQQAAQLRDRAAALENQAAHVPQPVGDRLRASAARLRGLAGKHDRTRITADSRSGK
jgi:integrase